MLLVKPLHQLSTEPDTIRLAISHLAMEVPDGERVISFGLYAVRKSSLPSFFPSPVDIPPVTANGLPPFLNLTQNEFHAN